MLYIFESHLYNLSKLCQRICVSDFETEHTQIHYDLETLKGCHTSVSSISQWALWRWSNPMAVCIAVIGKNNSPQFVACADAEAKLQFHYKVHTSLDIVEEKLLNVAADEIRKLYLGLLHSTEEHKIYGYATNTKIKFIIIIKTSNVTLRDNDVLTMFKKLHSSYVDIVSNPFYIPGDPLISKNFQSVVKNIMSESL